MSLRGLQDILDLKDPLENQVLRDQMVLMENQVKMVKKENRDPQAILENASIYQADLLTLDQKEIKENQESLVLLVKMAILDHKDLKENAANMHHLASQAILVNQENLVEMASQGNQEYLVGKDRKVKLLDWKKLKIKLKMASNLFVRIYKIVVIEIGLMDIINVIHTMTHLMILTTYVHHMERSVLIYKVIISILK